MIINELTTENADDFYSLCKAFYDSGATKREYDQRLAELTFKQVISKHENLWGYLIIDSETQLKAGYALITSYWCNEEGGNVVILDELFIDPKFRNRHFGRNLMKWLETEFVDKAVSITLEVLSTNLIAKDLYTKEGFYEDGFVTMSKCINKKNYTENRG